jgi:hypothetical protein
VSARVVRRRSLTSTESVLIVSPLIKLKSSKHYANRLSTVQLLETLNDRDLVGYLARVLLLLKPTAEEPSEELSADFPC